MTVTEEEIFVHQGKKLEQTKERRLEWHGKVC